MGLDDFAPADPEEAEDLARALPVEDLDQDLFDFPVKGAAPAPEGDELSRELDLIESLDEVEQAAAEVLTVAEPAPPTTAAGSDPMDEDLFGFDRLLQGSRAPASPVDDFLIDGEVAFDGISEEDLDAVLDSVDLGGSEPEPDYALAEDLAPALPTPPIPEPAAELAPGAVPEPAAPAFGAPAPTANPEGLDRSEPAKRAGRLRLVPLRLPLPRLGLAAAAALLLALNAALVIFLWSSLEDLRLSLAATRARASEARAADRPLARRPPALPPLEPASPDARPPIASEPAVELAQWAELESAARMIEDGAFGEARALLAAHLAVIDRLSGAERDAIEAQAGYLLAESFRLEADRLEEDAR